jgi:DNA polymerase III alpha subunit (gram-positive type)
MIRSNYLVHDCETGGLDPQKNPITQYACVILDAKTLKEIDRFETFVKPYNDLQIDQKSLDHTMVTMTDIKSGVDCKKFVSTLCNFYEQHRAKAKNQSAGRLISVGHNVTFDHGFIEYAMKLNNKNFWDYVYENFIDTQTLAKATWGLLGNEKIRLGDCCERAKIRLTDAHGAMNDVEATADLFRWFTKRLRAKVGDNAVEEINKRARGREFFEFKCGAK